MTTKHVTINIGPQDSESWLFLVGGIAIVTIAISVAWFNVNDSRNKADVERAKIEAAVKR
jgi:uncharacterized protein (UPF0212 family)